MNTHERIRGSPDPNPASFDPLLRAEWRNENQFLTIVSRARDVFELFFRLFEFDPDDVHSIAPHAATWCSTSKPKWLAIAGSRDLKSALRKFSRSQNFTGESVRLDTESIMMRRKRSYRWPVASENTWMTSPSPSSRPRASAAAGAASDHSREIELQTPLSCCACCVSATLSAPPASPPPPTAKRVAVPGYSRGGDDTNVGDAAAEETAEFVRC